MNNQNFLVGELYLINLSFPCSSPLSLSFSLCCLEEFDLIDSVLINTCQQVGFKMFLGVTASVTNWDAEGTCCSLVLEDNPLVDFVELPDTCQGLYYCNILSGVVRGALEMVRFPALFIIHFYTCVNFL